MYDDYIMIQVRQLLGNDDYPVRTQITLTNQIKRVVEDAASGIGESLSEYLRKAALIRVMLEKNEEKDRKKLALRVVGSLKDTKNPNWKDAKSIYKWSRKIREEW